MIYGCARVSTDGQSVEAQVRALCPASARRVFRETASGAKSHRVRLRRMPSQLAAGDVLMVTRLGRLTRSTRDLLNTLASIADCCAGRNLPASPIPRRRPSRWRRLLSGFTFERNN